MKLRTVWGVLPAIIFDAKPTQSLDGATSGIFVTMAPAPEKEYEMTLAHELVHVKQNYVMFGVIVLSGILSAMVSVAFLAAILALTVWRLTPNATFVLECAAYAETVRQKVAAGATEQAAIASTAAVLDNQPFYRENATLEQITKQISQRYADKRIF